MKIVGWIVVIVVVVWALTALFDGDDREVVDVPDSDLGEEVEEIAEEMAGFTATIKNMSDTQPLSSGVYVVHTAEVSLDFEGALAPSELEPLAEVGSNSAFAELVRGFPGVREVITIDAPVLPGEEASFSFTATKGDVVYFSGIQMLVGTNDGYTLIDSVELTPSTILAVNHDAGTEENEAPGSGFEGGQPDPSRGEENIDNGVATDPYEVVSVHPQITDTVLELTLAKDY